MKLAIFCVPLFLAVPALVQTPAISKEVESVYPGARALYLDLHQSPELSFHETQTAAKLASRLRSLGTTSRNMWAKQESSSS
jgi:metal-dependent amidase/aminoacylase/carboxypeptidase family protein